jgi:hypothetical protein
VNLYAACGSVHPDITLQPRAVECGLCTVGEAPVEDNGPGTMILKGIEGPARVVDVAAGETRECQRTYTNPRARTHVQGKTNCDGLHLALSPLGMETQAIRTELSDTTPEHDMRFAQTYANIVCERSPTNRTFSGEITTEHLCPIEWATIRVA